MEGVIGGWGGKGYVGSDVNLLSLSFVWDYCPWENVWGGGGGWKIIITTLYIEQFLLANRLINYQCFYYCLCGRLHSLDLSILEFKRSAWGSSDDFTIQRSQRR